MSNPKLKIKQRMILTSTSGFFVLHGMDSSQGHFTDSLVVSKSSCLTRVLTNQAYLGNGLSSVCVRLLFHPTDYCILKKT